MATNLVKRMALTYQQKKLLRMVCDDLFERYRFCKFMEFDKFEGQILDIEGEKDEQRERGREFCEQIERCVERLPGPEREIIRRRYMQDDELDYRVQMDLEISDGTYDKRRYNAFVKLADVFKLEYGADIPTV